jgi:hypothetical protein
MHTEIARPAEIVGHTLRRNLQIPQTMAVIGTNGVMLTRSPEMRCARRQTTRMMANRGIASAD